MQKAQSAKRIDISIWVVKKTIVQHCLILNTYSVNLSWRQLHCFSMQSETSLRKQWLYDVISQTAQNAGNSTQPHVHEHDANFCPGNKIKAFKILACTEDNIFDISLSSLLAVFCISFLLNCFSLSFQQTTLFCQTSIVFFKEAAFQLRNYNNCRFWSTETKFSDQSNDMDVVLLFNNKL